MNPRPRSLARWIALTASVLMLLVVAPAAGAAPTVITLGFDDGLASQYANRHILSDHNIPATFFINSAKVGRGSSMTWAQITDLKNAGHEIGGHTLNHVKLATLPTATQQQEICDDRTALTAHGFTPTSFAYPHGSWNTAVAAVVANCGYTNARTAGGLDTPPDCCVYAETFPPKNPYILRAEQLETGTTLTDLQNLVQRARTHGGGWLNIIIHDICTTNCTGSYRTNATTLTNFITWAQTLPDTQFRTTTQALTGR